MKQATVPIGCALTAEEYKRFKNVCDQCGTYPSAAVRAAIMEWMERNEKDGMGTA